MTYQTHQPNITTSTRTPVHFRLLFIIPFTSSGTSHVPCTNSPRHTPTTVLIRLHHGRRFIPRVLPTTDESHQQKLSYALFVTPLIFNLGIRWRRVVKFMPWPSDPWKKCRYSWSIKMGWPQSQFGCFADWIKLLSVPGCKSRTSQAVA
jgi:hypothetical protein